MLGCKMLKRRTEETVDTGSSQTTRVQPLKGAMGPVPFAFAPGGFLAQLRAGSVALWDTKTWKVAKTLPLAGAFAVGPLADGSLAAVAAEAGGGARIVRIAQLDDAPQSFSGPLAKPFLLWAYVLPDKTPASFLFISPNSQYGLERVSLASEGKAQREILFPMGPEDYASVISLSPGTAAYYEGGTHHIVQAAAQSPPVRFALSAAVRPVRHLARGPGEREVWVSDDAGSVKRLELVEPVRVASELPPGPGRVFHLASSITHLAVLWFEQPSDGTANRFTLIVYDATGKESFRTELPPSTRPEQRFVAVGPTAVLCGGSETFLAWSLDTGRLLLSTSSADSHP